MQLENKKQKKKGQTLPTTDVSIHDCTSLVTVQTVEFMQQRNITLSL